MIGDFCRNSRGIVDAHVSPVEDRISHKPSALPSTSTNNKPCRLMVKHMHSVSATTLLLGATSSQGAKCVNAGGKTVRRRLVLGGAPLHLRFYFGKLACAQMGTSLARRK